jgi:hypothetical protein
MADSTSSWSQLYSELKKNHDEAYFMIDEAIKLEMGGKQNEVCEEIFNSHLVFANHWTK